MMMGVSLMIPIFLQTVLGCSALKGGLETVKGLPEALKQTILDGLSVGGMQMGMPGGADAAPGAVRQLMATLFKTWFAAAINTTFIVGVALAFSGAFRALLLLGQPLGAPHNPISAEAQGEASPAVTGSTPVVTPDHT